MTPRERMFSLLQGKQPDKVPWFGDLDYWANSLIKRGLKPNDFVTSDAYLDWHHSLGVGYYLQGHFPFKEIYHDCEVSSWTEGNCRYRKVVTPHGELRECWEYCDETFSEAPVEYLLKSEEDIPAMIYMYDHLSYEPDYEYANKRKQQVGDQGAFLCYLPKSPFMHLVALEAGIVTVTMLAYSVPDQFEDLLKSMKRAFDQAAQISVDSPAELLMIPENLSSEMVGGTFFEMYMKDYQTEWTTRIREAGKYSFIHIDGTLQGLLKQESLVGFSVLEALTPYPVGDMSIEEMTPLLEDSKSVFWGGIPGVYFTPHISDEEFDRHVIGVLKIMCSIPRFALGVADQVPPDCLEYRVKRVGELVEKYGSYCVADNFK